MMIFVVVLSKCFKNNMMLVVTHLFHDVFFGFMMLSNNKFENNLQIFLLGPHAKMRVCCIFFEVSNLVMVGAVVSALAQLSHE